jgi:ubiquinone/menaquinone biosynthesis C-methylase UbiE
MGRLIRNQLINKLCDAQLKRLAQIYARGRLIDVGCGTKQYEDIFKAYVVEHVGVDHADSQHSRSRVDLISSGYEIPVSDASFDTVLHTSVLEHMEDPKFALQECARVLKPGGNIIFAVPFMWQVHEAPRDFFRFTPLGMKYLFEQTGFRICEITPICGFWGTFGQFLAYKIYKYPFLRSHLALTNKLSLLLQLCAHVADRLEFDEEWPAMFVGAAERVVT